MKIRILIVDDEPEIAEGLEMLLKAQNPDYSVVGKAYDGLEGFDRAIELHPDIIITDIRMPQASGLDMLRDIMTYETDTEFILISGYADFEYAKRAMEYGVQYFLTKPVDEEELYACIEKIRSRMTTGEELVELSDLIPQEMLNDLDEAMDSLDPDFLKKTVNRIFGVLRSNGKRFSLESIRRLCLNLVLYGTRRYPCASLRVNHQMGINVFSARGISRMQSLEEMKNWTANMLQGSGEMLRQEQNDGRKDLISEAKAFILENYTSNITLNEIADRFYVNPVYFSQLFKKKTGITYQKYVTELRMQRAKALLKETDRKVYEICEEVGYTDTNYFSKLFERSIGMKPSAYRTEHRR